jgi:tetraacyldisaccharide-1-P 4'-kinase
LPDDVVCSAPEILAVRRLGEAENVPLGGIRNKKVLLVSGIGNPGGFLRTMAAHGCSVAGHLAFRDHRVFTLRDIASIRQAFGSHGCEVVVTTQKDAVRLERADLIEALGDLPVFHTVMRLRWVGGQAPFLERLKRLG